MNYDSKNYKLYTVRWMNYLSILTKHAKTVRKNIFYSRLCEIFPFFNVFVGGKNSI